MFSLFAHEQHSKCPITTIFRYQPLQLCLSKNQILLEGNIILILTYIRYSQYTYGTEVVKWLHNLKKERSHLESTIMPCPTDNKCCLAKRNLGSVHTNSPDVRAQTGLGISTMSKYTGATYHYLFILLFQDFGISLFSKFSRLE